MKFQVMNDKGVGVMETHYASCMPDDAQLASMSKVRYKFKIDGKVTSIKKVKEVRDNV